MIIIVVVMVMMMIDMPKVLMTKMMKREIGMTTAESVTLRVPAMTGTTSHGTQPIQAIGGQSS